MEDGRRIDALKALVIKITKILTMTDTTGIRIRFMNALDDENYNNICDVEEAERIMSQINFNGRYTRLGKVLESKILEPFVFQKIATTTLHNPILVTIITDGKVSFPL